MICWAASVLSVIGVVQCWWTVFFTLWTCCDFWKVRRIKTDMYLYCKCLMFCEAQVLHNRPLLRTSDRLYVCIIPLGKWLTVQWNVTLHIFVSITIYPCKACIVFVWKIKIHICRLSLAYLQFTLFWVYNFTQQQLNLFVNSDIFVDHCLWAVVCGLQMLKSNKKRR